MPGHTRPVFSCPALLYSLALAASNYGVLLAESQGTAARTAPAAFLVDETGVGDLNGDGDSADSVLHVYDARRGVTLNLRVAAASVCRATPGPPFTICTPVAPVVDRTTIAFLVGELAQGATDLNGDGDADDDVLHVFGAASDGVVNTGLAVAHGVGRDVSSYTYPGLPVLSHDGIALLVSESEQGGTDLNRDGDASDAVLHAIEPKTVDVLNLELAAATVPGPFGSRNPIWPQLDGQTVTFVAGEPDQGSLDLNGDGDVDDQVTYRLKLQNGRLRPAR